MTERIRRARGEDAAILSALGIRSKSHWGYDEAHMRVFRAELTLAPSVLEQFPAFLLERSGRSVGYYTLAPLAESGPGEIELVHLFVEPDLLGEGCGRALFDHARATARVEGYRTLVIISDPNAAGFYERMGAGRAGVFRTPEFEARELPIFHCPVGDADGSVGDAHNPHGDAE